MHIDKTIQKKKRNKETIHLNTVGKCSLSENCQIQEKTKMQVLALEEEFGESLEDEVCNVKRHF